MPCYRCGVRQTDPDRGQSPWKRGVRQDRQVLICPQCQESHDWISELDRCPSCSSAHLVRRLGEVECRDCGTILPPSASPASAGRAGDSGGSAGEWGDQPVDQPAEQPVDRFADEVADALARVLGRGVAKARPTGPTGSAGVAGAAGPTGSVGPPGAWPKARSPGAR